MKVAIEISYYPLQEEYETTIINFIDRLNHYDGIGIKTNSMSTQIVGDYDLVMQVLTKEMKTSLSEHHLSAMVLKILNKEVDLDFKF